MAPFDIRYRSYSLPSDNKTGDNKSGPTDEELDITKFLYDKEVERTKLLVEKTASAMALLAVDSGLIALQRAQNKWSVFLTAITALSIFLSMAFTTKINSKKMFDCNIECTKSSLKEYLDWLHKMNLRKEIILYCSYIFGFLVVAIQVAKILFWN